MAECQFKGESFCCHNLAGYFRSRADNFYEMGLKELAETFHNQARELEEKAGTCFGYGEPVENYDPYIDESLQEDL